MPKQTAVILAGGKSSRMGFDKQCISLDGRLLVERQIQDLREVFDEIIVVTNKQQLYEGLGCSLVRDEIKDFGPLGGIHAGLKHSNSEYCYFVACDMPYINKDYILYMLSMINIPASGPAAVVTRFGKWLEPFNAVYSKRLIPVIERAYKENNRRISSVLKETQVHYIEEAIARGFSPDWSMFTNINTQEDLFKLK